MDCDLTVGIIGVGGAILGSITGALMSAFITHVAHTRKERTRVMIEVEEYLDDLWNILNNLYHLKDSTLSCSDEAEENKISLAYYQHMDEFLSIWNLRKRILELNIYFNDPECSYIFNKIERLYEKSKNKVEALSPFLIVNNEKLLEGLLNIKGDIIDHRDDFSQKLLRQLSWQYIFFPTFAKWGHAVKERFSKERIA